VAHIVSANYLSQPYENTTFLGSLIAATPTLTLTALSVKGEQQRPLPLGRHGTGCVLRVHLAKTSGDKRGRGDGVDITREILSPLLRGQAGTPGT
jgi:hypothetical protein